ncbi:MAG: aldo/keto reductase [Clostridia bacterium]|nr:aldo/keto reductase [Clostridia bacterium]
MKYHSDRLGNELSVLGFGCMRFPSKMGRINMEETEKEILFAVENGINYFDTAYIYPGSEAALGEILEKNGLRDGVKIATKLPHYLIKKREDIEKMFREELRRLRTDHVDFYLMHMLTDQETFLRLKDLGVCEWIEEKKKSGEIGQIGFSYHGNSTSFCELVDAYPWDFTMIQYNYMDENSQAGKKGLRYAHSKGLSVMIMEPLRGGKLVKNLSREAKELFSSHPRGLSPASWSFRWLWNQPEVTVVLSGMNSMEMLKENIAEASSASVGEFGEEEDIFLKKVVLAINSGMKVGCTGCGYCMPCPKKVDIPGTFSAYNRIYSENKFWGLVEYFMCTALRQNTTSASQCISCGKCEHHCPQNIPIRKCLKDACKELEGPIYKIAKKIAKAFVRF